MDSEKMLKRGKSRSRLDRKRETGKSGGRLYLNTAKCRVMDHCQRGG